MLDWCPFAERVPAPSDKWGTYRDDDGKWKFVIHTTESTSYPKSRDTYYGHQSWPHFTIHNGLIYQHIPIGRAARALKNTAGGVETNADRAVQVEVAWKAEQAEQMPEKLLDAIRRLGLWVSAETGMPWQATVRFVGPEERPYGVNAKQRMSHRTWDNYEGVCGHQHVPENDHWDPGHIDIAYLTAVEENDVTPQEHQWLENVENRTSNLEGAMSGLINLGNESRQLHTDQIARLEQKVDALAAGGGSVDVDALAAAVADTLVKRLKD